MIKEVLDVMIELAESGMTMLVVTHERICDCCSTPSDLYGWGRNVEANDTLFNNPQNDRTKLFLSHSTLKPDLLEILFVHKQELFCHSVY